MLEGFTLLAAHSWFRALRAVTLIWSASFLALSYNRPTAVRPSFETAPAWLVTAPEPSVDEGRIAPDCAIAGSVAMAYRALSRLCKHSRNLRQRIPSVRSEMASASNLVSYCASGHWTILPQAQFGTGATYISAQSESGAIYVACQDAPVIDL